MRRMALVEPSICAGHGVPCPYKRPRTGRTQQRQSRDLRSRCADRSHGSCAAADSGCRLISQARPTKFVTRVRRDPSTPPPRRTPTKPVLVCFGEDGAAERQMETCATYSAIKERYGSRLGSRTKFSRHLQIGRFGAPTVLSVRIGAERTTCTFSILCDQRNAGTYSTKVRGTSCFRNWAATIKRIPPMSVATAAVDME